MAILQRPDYSFKGEVPTASIIQAYQQKALAEQKSRDDAKMAKEQQLVDTAKMVQVGADMVNRFTEISKKKQMDDARTTLSGLLATGATPQTNPEIQGLAMKAYPKESGEAFTKNLFAQMYPEQQPNKPPELTPGQKAVDAKFAGDYNDYVVQGGAAGQITNLNKLNRSIKSLENMKSKIPGKNVAQRVSGLLPNSVRGLVTPEYARIEQDARTNVLGLLRATLGPQFTEKEGENIFRQTFDPTLPLDVNISRLKDLSNSLQQAGISKRKAAAYYEKNGTLAGYRGELPNITGYGEEAPNQGIPEVGQSYQGAKVIKVKRIK
jgi:hypothetical protein